MKAVGIDTALEFTENGWFHWRLMTIGFLTFLGTGFEFTLHAYILPFAECDLEIDAAKMGVINAVFLGGSLISSVFWGILADASGRKKIMVYATIIEGICTVIASWSNSYVMFMLLRVVCGFLCGAGATVCLSYVGEFCCDKIRPRNICILGFAWTASWLLIPILAAGVTTLDIQIVTPFVTYKSWRLFVALVGVPNICSGLLIATFLPETPKYNLSQGYEKQALQTLQWMYSKNTGREPKTYPVTRLITGNPDLDNNSIGSSTNLPKKGFFDVCAVMMSQMKTLLRPPLLKSTMFSGSVYMCGMFGYYGLGLWLPELFKRFDEFSVDFPNATASVCQLSKIQVFDNITNSTELLINDCDDKKINLALFTDTFILGTTCALGNLSVTYLSSKFPARFIAAVYFEIAAICVVSFYFLSSPPAVLAVASLFLATTNAAISVHNICAINLFPTAMRGMGMCLSFFCGRISAVLSSLAVGHLIDVYCEVPVVLVTIALATGGFICLIMPKSSQNAME